LFDIVTGNSLVTCDDLLECDDCSLTHPVTFQYNVAHSGTFIAHFCVSRNLKHSVVKSYIIDSGAGANLSHHLPICIEIKCDSVNLMNDRREIVYKCHFQWDKADVLYYHTMYSFFVTNTCI